MKAANGNNLAKLTTVHSLLTIELHAAQLILLQAQHAEHPAKQGKGLTESQLVEAVSSPRGLQACAATGARVWLGDGMGGTSGV